jgi:phosphoglycolate phosphatase-like HAD superfamily hydrolase
MDSPTSLLHNVVEIVNGSSSEAKYVVDRWLTAYGSYFGDTFDSRVQGPEPFQWVIRTSLPPLLSHVGLAPQCPQGSPCFERLCAAWGQLTPWPHTADVLTRLAPHFAIGTLSNGDAKTLTNAVSIFTPPVHFAYIFSSDYPVGAFKPNARIYEQALAAVGADAVLHVAGSAVDAAGARAAGAFVALLRDTPTRGHEPCFALSDITGLPAVLNV